VLGGEKEYAQAEAMYRKTLEQNPDFIRARLNLGNCLEQQKRDDEALEQWRIALKSESILLPENLSLQLHALNNLGRLLEMKKSYQESLQMLEKSFSLDPTQRDVLLHLVHLIQKICRWPIYVPPKGITKKEMINGTSPLAMLAASDDPALQLAAAQQFVEHKYPVTSSETLAPKRGYKHEKIRIGYLSSDFCLHAVSLLTVELLELHDHDRFEVYGFCWSREDGTSIQKRVINSMDHYIKIGEMTDREAADCIRSHEIDIIIDLQGLTSGARPLILSYRPATIQMTYLGFPGTTGLPWIDYVISDKYLIPDELAPYHTEKPLYMPNCFQSSDSKREIGPMPTRADNGLPEKAFVFCSFNNNYKFTPELFSVWMRILKHVPGSVFWLLADNEWAKENLIKAARKMGIKKERLIFAPRVAPADYLARYQLADLFLDTFPFNGGTTANDALFMGLPLLTLSGRTFASRMAGSLLTYLGLPELITNSLKEYEERAVSLAKKTAELAALKNRLKDNKASGSVFDMPKFVKGLESKLIECLNEYLHLNRDVTEISFDDQGRTSGMNVQTATVNSGSSRIPDMRICGSKPQKKIAIASIQRDRGPWIVEWLAFHMLVGFNQFYIYSHKCVDDMTYKLQKLSQHYPIAVHEISSDDRPQLVCYQHAYNAYGSQVDWMAFIDGDEFLFPTSQMQIGDTLAEYEDMDLSAIAAFWKCYGSSGHIIEPQGLIVENYPRHSSQNFPLNRHVKSIIKGRQEDVIASASHVFQTPRGTYDELLRPINHGLMKDLEPSYEKFRINHYTTQSWEFFCNKKKNIGAADFDSNYVRPDDWYPRHDRNECDDGASYNFLVPLKLKVIEMMKVITGE
jgi:predicted O-linked N-acetylglucosamine transferase (SPINDLY family)